MSSTTKIVAIVGAVLIAAAGGLWFYSSTPNAGADGSGKPADTRGYAPKK